ncbi:MAG: hypothetical protein QNJ49_12030 [Mastigocoleus sp. MO_167.B18]|nr:hypothetical protein [Mastigocoleus sp. MO_167.B18]
MRFYCLGHFGWIWSFLHETAMLVPIPGIRFLLSYLLISWIGVMLSEYAFGTVLTKLIPYVNGLPITNLNIDIGG